MEKLSRDVLMCIFSELDLKNICNIMLTCKRFRIVCNYEAMWKMLSERHFKVDFDKPTINCYKKYYMGIYAGHYVVFENKVTSANQLLSLGLEKENVKHLNSGAIAFFTLLYKHSIIDVPNEFNCEITLQYIFSCESGKFREFENCKLGYEKYSDLFKCSNYKHFPAERDTMFCYFPPKSTSHLKKFISL